MVIIASDSTGNCDNTSGTWSGTGNVKLLILSCGYDATVQVSEGNPASAHITVNRTSGIFLCPKKVNMMLQQLAKTVM